MSANPKHIGPGYWANWHTNSLRTNTRDKKAELARNIVTSIDNFPYSDCRKDSIAYIKKNPLLPAVEDRDPFSLFNWTVYFHNHVNLKLDREALDLQMAKDIWSGEKAFCTGNCGLSESEIKPEKKLTIEVVIKGYD